LLQTASPDSWEAVVYPSLWDSLEPLVSPIGFACAKVCCRQATQPSCLNSGQNWTERRRFRGLGVLLRITILHIRACATVLGCVILAASFFDWMRLFQIADRFVWVGVEASGAPALELAEVWQAKASCTRPFFVKALLESKLKLKAYYERAPEEVQASRYFSEGSREQRGSAAVIKTKVSRQAEADAELEASLHVQHAEWFATVYKLELEEKRWRQRMESVADQNLVLGDSTRRSFAAYSIHGEGAQDGNALERHVLFLLGLSGFAKDEEQAVKLNCVSITPIKKIFTHSSAMRELWYWPFNYIATFSLGLELIMIGVFLIPIVLWIRTGDLRVSKNYLSRSIRRGSAEILGKARASPARNAKMKFVTRPL
jgi:hypothetical protein